MIKRAIKARHVLHGIVEAFVQHLAVKLATHLNKSVQGLNFKFAAFYQCVNVLAILLNLVGLLVGFILLCSRHKVVLRADAVELFFPTLLAA